MRQRILLTWGLGLALLAGSTAPKALATAPRLDRGFGQAGIARTSLPPAYDTERFKEVAAAPDGGALVRAGYFDSGEVLHYGPEGALLGEETAKETVILQPPEAPTATGGRVVGDGREHAEGEGSEGTVTRFGPDGSVDTSFGTGGTATLPFAVEAVAALPSGKVLAAGADTYKMQTPNKPGLNQVVVARLDSDGNIDPSFGKEGVASLYREDNVYGTHATHVQGWGGEGAEVVIGSTIVALDASGNLDPSFGKKGQATAPGQVVGAAATMGEELLVAGAKSELGSSTGGEEEEGPEEFYVARYTAAGQLDPTYAAGSGVAVLAPQGDAQAGSVLFGADGSVLIGGLVKPRSPSCPGGYTCGRTPAVARFTPAGNPDAGFGDGGLLLLSALTARIGRSEYVWGVDSLAARPGGGFYAAGEGQQASFVAALEPDGSPVPGFGTAGLATESSPLPSSSSPTAIGTDRAGDIFVTATTDSESWLSLSQVLLRYSPAGKLDRDFGHEGEAFVPPGAQALAVAPDGSAYLASAGESSLIKLTPAGALDPGFGNDRSADFPFSKREFTPWASSLQGAGDLLVAGELRLP